MKNKLKLINCILILIMISCTDNRNVKEEQIIQNQTPEILDQTKTDSKITSIKKRYSGDIVQELFDEAVSKDSKLKDLTDRIDKIGKSKSDSLIQYNTYIQNNNRYWSTANDYINQLSDSSIRKQMKEVFKNLKADYEKMIIQHKILDDKINLKTVTLSDQEILIKLLVTEPMMTNYQRNELPDIKKMNRIIYMYDTLINETKAYTKINK
jgi:hypothetical protein